MLSRILLFAITTLLIATPTFARQADAQIGRSAVLAPAAATLVEGGYYTNRAGIAVHRPAHTNDNQAPAGASAKCRDATFSFSMSRRGTCSHHGGVADWL